jgi:hypothetical protein
LRSAIFRVLLLTLSSAEVAKMQGVGGGREGGSALLLLATHHVALQLFMLPCAVLFDGLAVVGQVLVADSIGRHALGRAAKVGRVLLGYGLGLGSALSVLLLGGDGGGGWWGWVEGGREGGVLLARMRPLAWVLAVLMPLTGYVQVAAGLLQGGGDYGKDGGRGGRRGGRGMHQTTVFPLTKALTKSSFC